MARKKKTVVTLSETDKEINQFLQYWKDLGVVLPDPDNYPICFSWYVKMWKHNNADVAQG